MAKTQGEIVDEARYRLNEGQQAFYDDRELRIWINEACRDIARQSMCLRASDSVSAVASTQDYTLASDVLMVTAVYYTATGESVKHELRFHDKHAMGMRWGTHETISEGTPSYWTTWGAPPSLTLKLYPTPSRAGTIQVDHYRLPTELATADESAMGTDVDLPSGWEDLILDYLEYRAYLKAGRADRARVAKADYMEHLHNLTSVAMRFSDQAGQLVNESHYFGGGAVWDVNDLW